MNGDECMIQAVKGGDQAKVASLASPKVYLLGGRDALGIWDLGRILCFLGCFRSSLSEPQTAALSQPHWTVEM